MQIRINKKLFLILGGAVSLLLMGCGGDDSNSAGGTAVTSSSYSVAEYVNLANGICKRSNEAVAGKIGAYVNAHSSPKTDPQKVFEAAIQADVLPAVQEQVQELRSLGAPSGKEKQIETFLAALESAATAHSTGQVPPEEVFSKDFERSAKLANELGLESCAYEG